MSIRAVMNPNTNPVQIQRDGVNFKTLTWAEASTLRDDLTRLLGDGVEKAKRAGLVGAVVDAAKKWERGYATSTNYLDSHGLDRLALQRTVQALVAFDNGGRPIPNFDTGVYAARKYSNIADPRF